VRESPKRTMRGLLMIEEMGALGREELNGEGEIGEIGALGRGRID